MLDQVMDVTRGGQVIEVGLSCLREFPAGRETQRIPAFQQRQRPCYWRWSCRTSVVKLGWIARYDNSPHALSQRDLEHLSNESIGEMRDAQAAKPQTFRTGDGWFIHNLVDQSGPALIGSRTYPIASIFSSVRMIFFNSSISSRRCAAFSNSRERAAVFIWNSRSLITRYMSSCDISSRATW